MNKSASFSVGTSNREPTATKVRVIDPLNLEYWDDVIEELVYSSKEFIPENFDAINEKPCLIDLLIWQSYRRVGDTILGRVRSFSRSTIKQYLATESSFCFVSDSLTYTVEAKKRLYLIVFNKCLHFIETHILNSFTVECSEYYGSLTVEGATIVYETLERLERPSKHVVSSGCCCLC